jgi:hypothetical protein
MLEWVVNNDNYGIRLLLVARGDQRLTIVAKWADLS